MPSETIEGHPSFARVELHDFELSTRCWLLPDSRKPRALLLIAHGLGEHSAAYDKIVPAFLSKDIAVYSHDHIGHGRSPGVRALINDISQVWQPLLSHATQIRAANPSTPLFLLGHSMGGLAAAICASKAPGLFKGVVLHAPALEACPDFLPAWKVFVGRIVAWLCPQMLMPDTELRDEFITSDPEVVKEMHADPLLFHQGIRAATGRSILDGMESLAQYRANFPLLLLHSRDDRLTYYAGSERFFQRARAEDKEFVSYDNLAHECFNELQPYKTQVRETIAKWILDRV